MANSIVFQNSAEQLKSAVFGYDGVNYLPLSVNAYGVLNSNVGTITTIANITSITGGTISKVTSLTNGTVTVSKISSITNGTVNVNRLSSITGGTISKLSSITSGTVSVAAINSITSGTVNVNITNRTFTETTQNITVAAATSTYSTLINISKYQDTSWYIKNTTATSTQIVTVQLAVTPSSDRSAYPLVLVQETATVKLNPKAMTNSYYMKYITAKFTNATGTSQNAQIVFNGRY